MSKTTTDLLLQQVGTITIDRENEGRAVRKIVQGCNMIEFGILEIQDEHKGELKMRANTTVKWAISVVKWLIGHPNANLNQREKINEEYHNNDRNAMMAELFDTVADLNADDLAMITESIKAHIDTKKQSAKEEHEQKATGNHLPVSP